MSFAVRQSTRSLQVVIPSGITSSLKVSCSPTPPPASSSHNTLKRKHTEISIDSAPTTVTSHRPEMCLAPLPICEPYDASSCPSSPAPTEIIDIEPEDYVATAKQHGVKVRDYAYEPRQSTCTPAPPEVWKDPILTLIRHDLYIRRPNQPIQPSFDFHKFKLFARLLSMGWITMEEARRNWSEEVWVEVKKCETRPQGLYSYVLGEKVSKPTARLRESMRVQNFGVLPEDKLEESIYVPPDVPGMYDGPEEVVFHLDKKRRIDISGTRPSAMATPTLRLSTSLPPVRYTHSRTSTPPLGRGNSLAELVPTPTTTPEDTRPPPRRGLTRTQTMVLVQ